MKWIRLLLGAALGAVCAQGPQPAVLALGKGPLPMTHESVLSPADPRPWPLIPAPRAFTARPGHLDPQSLARILLPATEPGVAWLGSQLSRDLQGPLGRRLPVQVQPWSADLPGSICLELVKDAADAAFTSDETDPEAYRLEISPQGATVTAVAQQGLIRGCQGLIQLLTVASMPDNAGPVSAADPGLVNAADPGPERATGSSPPLPCGIAHSAPRYRWRGMLLDCGRHFMPVPVVKGLLDRLARYHFNVLHWHLTEDQGWRLEVPGYPLLTQVGAFRTGSDGRRLGGSYTDQDINEIVAYAAERGITVVPEIEMPGHCVAALAAYPHLSCTGGPFAVQTQWGVHKDVFCAGKEETFTFLQAVLDQVMALFPSPYIHIGGDEVPKDRWRECSHCQARIKAEGLTDEADLQRWFVARIERYLAGHGRRLVGWDEILEGGLAQSSRTAIIQSWRGTAGAVAAVTAGLDAIVSPTSHCYFDYDCGALDLQQVFGFDPQPPGLEGRQSGHILGGALNLWTEYIPPTRVDGMLFPRLPAMAEALWTADPGRDFAGFTDRLARHDPVLADLGVRSGAAARPVRIHAEAPGTRQDHAFVCTIDPRVESAFAGRDLVLRRRVIARPRASGYRPDLWPERQDLPRVAARDPQVTGPVAVPAEEDALLAVQLFLDGRPYGAPATAETAGNLARGAAVQLAAGPGPRHPGGGAAGLVDGRRGSPIFTDGLWAGFEGVDFEAVIDLGRALQVGSLAVGFLQDANSWIFLPQSVEFSVANEPAGWTPVGAAGHDVPDQEQTKTIREFQVAFPIRPVRYVRVTGKSPGVCPLWHPGAGQPCWIFADEITVR